MAGTYVKTSFGQNRIPCQRASPIAARRAIEYIFLLSKSQKYYYNCDAVKEDCEESQIGRIRDDVIGGKSHAERGQHSKGGTYRTAGNKTHKTVTEYERSDSEIHRTAAGLLKISDTAYEKRNKRSVWTVTTKPFPEAHFATYPAELIKPCILAGCPCGRYSSRTPSPAH